MPIRCHLNHIQLHTLVHGIGWRVHSISRSDKTYLDPAISNCERSTWTRGLICCQLILWPTTWRPSPTQLWEREWVWDWNDRHRMTSMNNSMPNQYEQQQQCREPYNKGKIKNKEGQQLSKLNHLTQHLQVYRSRSTICLEPSVQCWPSKPSRRASSNVTTTSRYTII